MLFAVEVFVLFFLTATLQAAIGFGGGLVCMAILPYIVPNFSMAALYLQAIYVLYTGYLAFSIKAKLRLDILLPIQIPTLIFTVIFTIWSVTSINTHIMNIILGSALLLIAVYFMFMAEKINFKPTVPVGVTMGVVTGIFNGLFSFGGPPAVLYLAPSIDDKMQYIKAMQFYFFCSNVVSLVIRFANAKTDAYFWGIVSVGWVAVFIGAFAGLKIAGILNAKTIKKLIYGFIGIDGVWMILSNSVFKVK